MTIKNPSINSGTCNADLCRPCFVVMLSPGHDNIEAIIYLRVKTLPWNHFNSLSKVSNPASSLWHFSGILGHSLRLSRFSRRHRVHSVPRLIFSASTNTTDIAVCASMDLPDMMHDHARSPKTCISFFNFICGLEQMRIVTVAAVQP